MRPHLLRIPDTAGIRHRPIRPTIERGVPIAALNEGRIQREVVITFFVTASPFTGPNAGGGAR